MPILAGWNDLAHIIAFQHFVYAENRAIIGVEPIPLLADYEDIFARMEIWIEGHANDLKGVAILDLEQDKSRSDLYLWSIATNPHFRKSGIGNQLLAFVEQRAHALGYQSISLSTNSFLTDRIAWYARHGFAITHNETMQDRVIVHMRKLLERS